jgi:hypothetical protein
MTLKLPSIHYITVATKPHRVLDTIKKRVDHLNEKITSLGEKENRLIGWEGSSNFGIKLREVAEFLKTPHLDPDDVVLFTDAYDVVYCGNQEEILERYLSFSKPIVFGAERLCQPDVQLAERYPELNTEFPFLNSGMFIGRVGALRKCMAGYVYIDKVEDQRYWTEKFLFSNPDLIELDYENQLFLNTVSIDMRWFMVDKSSGHSFIIYRSATPMFVHINGPDKSLIDELI